MDILPVNFKVLRFCGAWDDPGEEGETQRNAFLRLFSFCYRYAVVILIYYITVCEVIELLLTDNDIDDMAEILFLTLTFVALCLKYGNFLTRKNEVISLLDRFRSEECQSRNPTERHIIKNYDRKAKWCVLSFMTLSQATGLAMLFAPVLSSERARRLLPIKMYLPYSVTDWIPYLATYCQQAVGLTYGILLNVSFDSLVYGFTLRLCGQIELLCHRVTEIFNSAGTEHRKTMPSRRSLLGRCVRHHVLVQELMRRIQSLFVWWITILFIFSLITLCTSIFQMSKKTLISAEFLSLLLYFGSMLFQIFFYCWYGNELELKSKRVGDAVYSSNWTTATTQDRKSLVIMMTISQRGLILSYYGIFALALHTFTWIIKTSYSAFNLLQQLSH